MGGLLWQNGQWREAEVLLRQALQANPLDARTRHGLGLVLLGLDRWTEGWPYYEARHLVPQLGLTKPTLAYPEWQGEDLIGKNILLFREQGLGDQIMNARFAPMLRDRGADVTLICDLPLATLFEPLGVRVVAASGTIEFRDPDYWVMTGSVASRAGVTPATLPATPYIQLPPADPRGARIGIVTRGNPRHTNDANRSLRPKDAERLLAMPGAISLSPEDTGATTFLETAAIIAGLDVVVSVDTAIAHLAGAMGKPVRILLPNTGLDWRWGVKGDQSRWYPTAKLYRQRTGEPWASVIERVVRDL
jgi:hypothetical protein